jgi:hypothetical protein
MIVYPHSVALRYRVLTEAWDSGSAVLADVREFKTLKGAEAYQRSVPGSSIIQYGVLQWFDDEGASAEMVRLSREGRPIE